MPQAFLESRRQYTKDKVNEYFEILMQKIATYYSYEQQHNMFQNEECKFIGYIDSNPGNYQININTC